MSEHDHTKELRFFRKWRGLEYIKSFSPTQKVIFGVLMFIALFSAAKLAIRASDKFMIEVPARGGELREGVIGLPRTINPILAITDVDRDLTSLMYAGLMKYTNGELVPDLAESYTISKDGLTYTFKLKAGTRFHDGIPLTTDDIEFTITKIQNPNIKSPRRADWVDVSVKKISETEIAFHLKQAYTPFLSNTTIGIMPKHIWSSISDDRLIFDEHNIEPIGAGPYKFVNILRDGSGTPTRYALSAWNGYHNEKPFINKITLDFFTDQSEAIDALKNNTIDSIAAIDPEPAAKIANTDSTSRYQILSPSLPRIFGIFFNQNEEPIFADSNIREAINIAIDRKAIIKTVLYDYGTPIDGPLPVDILKTNIEPSSTSTLAIAEKLIEKRGWVKDADGIYTKKSSQTGTTTLSFDLYTGDARDLQKTAELVKEMLGEIGILVNVKIFEGNELYQNVIRTRKFGALLFGEQVGKDRDLYAFWHSSQRNSPGLNVALYTNSKVDKILEYIRSNPNKEEIEEDYTELDKLIRDDIPAVFIYSPDFIYIVPKKVKGIDLEDITLPSDRFNSVNNWYIHTEKIWKIFENSKFI